VGCRCGRLPACSTLTHSRFSRSDPAGVQLFAGALRRRCTIGNGLPLLELTAVCADDTVCADGATCEWYGENPKDGTLSFDTILQAWMSLAQVLTLEGWSDVALVLQQVGGQSSPTVNTVRALSPFSALCSLWGVHCGMLQQVGGAPAGVYVSTAHTVPALPLHPVHSSHRGAALCVVQLCVLDRRAGLVLRAQLAPGSDVASDHRAAGEEGQSVRQDDAARARANQGALGSQGS
jgi:hypothetical protein